MAWSTAFCFTDPLSFQAAISTADLELLATTKGQFRAELTRVCMDQLWIQRFYQNLPLINAGAMKPGRRVFTFFTSAEPAAMRHCGMNVCRETSSSTTSMRCINRPSPSSDLDRCH